MNIDDYIEDKLADIKSDEERDNFERSIRFLITNNAVADFDLEQRHIDLDSGRSC